MPSLTIAVLRLVPQHLLSRLVGRLAAVHLPPALRRPVLSAFGRTFGVDFGEVVGPLEDYASVQEFFTRPLPAGARPIDPNPTAVVAPCDGFWGASGPIEGGTILQVKGRPYSVAALLGSEEDARPFRRGTFATFYLAPRNYHRFHAPCAAEVTRAVYLPGALWPVNQVGLQAIDGLFARNERICAYMQTAGGALCLIAVGATNVGKIRLTFDDLTTNEGGSRPVERRYTGIALERGEEWGRFEFGSTIVLLAAEPTLRLEAQPPATPVRLGRRIGTA